MYKKIISFSMVLVLFYAIFLVPTRITVKANDDGLAKYRIALEELNSQLGTNYTFPTASQIEENGESYSDLVEFYTSMTISEFRNYVIMAYENEKNDIKIKVEDSMDNTSKIDMQSYTKRQRLFYDTKAQNYISLTSTLYSADGKERYARVNSYNYHADTYPYYKPTSMSSSKSTDYTQVTCSFSCVKYVAKNLTDATTHTVRATFRASGGDIYATKLI